MRTPERGDIWQVNLDPISGKEQRGTRPVLVVTKAALNAAGLTVICPITQGGMQSRFAGVRGLAHGYRHADAGCGDVQSATHGGPDSTARQKGRIGASAF